MNELPTEWIAASIGEINAYSGRNVDPLKTPEQIFELYSVPTYPTRKPEIVSGEEIGSTKQSLEPNDVLLCKINPRINRVWKTGPLGAFPQIGSSEWIVIRQPLIDADFLRYQLSESSFRELLCAEVSGVGGSLTRAQPKKVMNYKIALPPYAEQIQITQKLNGLLAQVDTLKACVDAIPTLLKRFRQSVLAEAVSGRLTEEWRNTGVPLSSARDLHQQIKNAHEIEGGHARGNASDPTEEAHDLSPEDLPGCWDIAEMRDICAPGRPITYGILKPGPELEEGVPYIRVADFPGNKLNLTNIKKTSPEIDQQFKRARLTAGDLLLSIRGSVGRVIKIPSSLEGANITQDTARLSISPQVSTDFVYWVLLSNATQRRMKNAIRGVAVRGINIGDVRALQIPLPAIEEQAEIIRRIEQLFAFADKLEVQINSAKIRIDHLTQSILANAFKGELTGDWRMANQDLITGKNSSASLLANIKAAREQLDRQAQAKSSKKTMKSKAGIPMSKIIIEVVEALKQSGEPLSGQQLLAAAGYPNDSSTAQLEQFFLDIRKSLTREKSIVKLERSDDGQDWFALADNEKSS